ncbi:transcriptional regulator, HxlR family [Pseudomonas sp. NFIX10]|nr:transcriptional regulator, HxlR family [Pseudomonas sp. NFIX10]SFE71949.1 transcriptional regulator, HxlR family [Pseudomonas sp. NFACC06-1]
MMTPETSCLDERVLTKTLRSLKREGLLIRRAFDEIPPRVEYELTPLGMGLLIRMSPIWT